MPNAENHTHFQSHKPTRKPKTARAKEIANHLSNNNKWKPHGHPINIEVLIEFRLEIGDYSDNVKKEKVDK